MDGYVKKKSRSAKLHFHATVSGSEAEALEACARNLGTEAEVTVRRRNAQLSLTDLCIEGLPDASGLLGWFQSPDGALDPEWYEGPGYRPGTLLFFCIA